MTGVFHNHTGRPIAHAGVVVTNEVTGGHVSSFINDSGIFFPALNVSDTREILPT